MGHTQSLRHRAVVLLSVSSLSLSALLVPACKLDLREPRVPNYADTTDAPYNFYHPDTLFRLPIDLSEISGLTALDSTHLGSVQDEDGILYFINARTGQVDRQVPFGRPGDYEGIERVGNQLYVVRSDGVLYEIEDWTTSAPVAREYATGIRASCDAEGLGYAPAAHSLLVACKQGLGGSLQHFREIYAIDLQRDTLRATNLRTLDVRVVNEQPNYDSPLDRKLRAFLSGFIDLSGYTPAALATHPSTGQLYIPSSGQKVIAVLDAQGVLETVWRIPDRYFPQPEGITFLPDGTLYISNEGSGGRATLMRFLPRRPGPGMPADSLAADTSQVQL